MAISTGSIQSRSRTSRTHWRLRMSSAESAAGATRAAEKILLFWAHVSPEQRADPHSCWEWEGTRNADGYGRAVRDGHDGAHRVAWLLTHGPVPSGQHVCHKCDNPPCINPTHLFLGTAKENARDRRDKGRQYGVVLTRSNVLRIREELAAGAMQSSVARQYGVALSTVNSIASNTNWADVR